MNIIGKVTVWGRPAAILAMAALLFLLDGAETVIAFLHHDSSQAALGGIATIIAVALGFVGRTPSGPQ